jgi:hypothetical protein
MQLACDWPAFAQELRVSVDNNLPWSAVQQLRSRGELEEQTLKGALHCDDYDSSSLIMDLSLQERVEALVPGCPLAGWLLVLAGAEKGEGGKSRWVQGKYCNEGNNVGDALQLAGLVARVPPLQLALENSSSSGQLQLSAPRSWASLLGPPMSLSSESMF